MEVIDFVIYYSMLYNIGKYKSTRKNLWINKLLWYLSRRPKTSLSTLYVGYKCKITILSKKWQSSLYINIWSPFYDKELKVSTPFDPDNLSQQI